MPILIEVKRSVQKGRSPTRSQVQQGRSAFVARSVHAST